MESLKDKKFQGLSEHEMSKHYYPKL